MATPAVMARTTGSLYLTGVLALAALLLAPAPRTPPASPELWGIVALGLVTSVLVFVWGCRLNRAAFHALVAMGTLLITLGVWGCPDGTSALAAASVVMFVGIDAVFFFAPLHGALHLGAGLALLSGSLLSHPDVGWGSVLALNAVILSTTVVIGTLVGRASAASRDPLTGLLNRRGFDEALEDAVRARARTGAPVSACLVDVDHFKEVNDRAGHAEGDLLLQQLAGRWRAQLPASVVLARHGGDEFALLLPGRTGPQALALLQALPDLAGASVSGGVAELRAGDRPAELMRRADAALYQAKDEGRACWRLHAGSVGTAAHPRERARPLGG